MHADTTLGRLARIPQAIAGERTYEGVLRAMAGELTDIMPFDHIDIVVLVAEGRDHICYETPVRTVWSALAETPQPTGLSPVRSVLSGTAPYILAQDAFTDERFHFEGAIDQPIFQATLRSRVIVPLRMRGMVFGSLNISRSSVSAYGPLDLVLGQHCARLIAPYLFALTAGQARGREEGAREMEAMRASLANLADHLEQDRRRLGMDLHDQTIADLSRIARRLAAIEDGGAALRPALAELRGEIGNCLTELRRIVEDALPAVLELFGLADALEETMRRAQGCGDGAMRMTLRDDSDGAAERLADVDRMLVYRIAQEAINNAVRHSGGSALSVRLMHRGNDLLITVEDDGRGGLNPRSPRGVSHMRSRAALLGAAISFAGAAAGGGTRVDLRVPLGVPALPQ